MKQVVLVIAIVFYLFALSPSAFSQVNSSTSQQEHPASYETLDGGVISVEEFTQGRWALGFIVSPGCPACEKVVEWFEQAAQAFPEVKFLLIASAATPEVRELVKTHAPEIPVLLDQDGVLGIELEIKRAPTVFLSAEGMYITRLDWPFTEGKLLRELAQSLLIKFPNPRDLLGKQAPNFSAVNLNGDKIGLADFPRPLLLAFLAANCPSCWDVLPSLLELPNDVAAGIVIPVRQSRLSTEHWEKLEQFQQKASEQGKQVAVVLDKWSKEGGFKILLAYKIKATPTFILVGKENIIDWVLEGPIEGGDLADAIAKALKGMNR